MCKHCLRALTAAPHTLYCRRACYGEVWRPVSVGAALAEARSGGAGVCCACCLNQAAAEADDALVTKLASRLQLHVKLLIWLMYAQFKA